MEKIKFLDSDIAVIKVNDEDFNYVEYATITSKSGLNSYKKECSSKINVSLPKG